MRKPRALLVLTLALAAGTDAAAQTSPARTGERGNEPSLKSRFGLEGLRKPLHAEASVLRQRAFERLGAAGTNAALELLSAALAPGGEARDARERLIAVRALAAHVDREIAVDALVRALAGTQAKEDPRESLVRQSAALALARSHRPRAQKALAQALRQPGRISETARLGLVAHRPSSITPLLEAAGSPTPALVRLLGELADARAIPVLTSLAASGPDELRAEALRSLGQIDRPRALELARALAKAEPTSLVGAAAVRLLVENEDPGAPAAFAALLKDPARRRAGFELALAAPSAELGSALAGLEPEPGDAEVWLAALGRSGGALALARLERTLADPERGWAAAYALAQCGDSDADAVLERALGSAATRRDAARAAALRQLSQARSTDGIQAAVAALERSTNPADRASAAFVRAALDPQRGAQLIAGSDPVLARSAARLASSGTLALAAAARLAREQDPVVLTSLALALSDVPASDLVPDSVLVQLLEGRGAAAHLAAYALAARDGSTHRSRLRELLANSDPKLRLHVALGLARSRDASAVGMLADAYRFEVEPRVRQALVLSLASRRERGRRTTLRLAADLDPDTETRERARRALGGGGEPSAQRPEAVWLRLDPRTSSEPILFAVVETGRGLALPAAPDPDGSVLLWPISPGKVEVTLATAQPSRR